MVLKNRIRTCRNRHDSHKSRLSPVAPELMAAVHRAALMADGIESAHVNLTFSPLWDPRVHASEDAKLDLGIFLIKFSFRCGIYCIC